MSVVLIVLIGLLVGASTIISTVSKLTDRRRKGLNVITSTGWLFILFNLGIIILSISQFILNDKEVDEKEKQSKAYYDSSLLVMKMKFDSSHLLTTTTIASELGKYGFKLDSTEQKLIKVINDKPTIEFSEEPILEICDSTGIIVDLKGLDANGWQISDLSLRYCNVGAGSSNFDMIVHLAATDNLLEGNIEYLDSMTYGKRPYRLGYGGYFTDVHTFSTPIKSKYFLLHIIGRYTNLQNTKRYSMDELYFYNRVSKNMGNLRGHRRTVVLDSIKSEIYQRKISVKQ